MKNIIISLLIAGFFSITNVSVLAQGKDAEGTITLSGAWAIYPTVVAWAEAFQRKYPKVRIDVSAGGAGKGAADAIAGLVDIGMVSRDPDPAEIKKGITPIYILHDAVFPVTNDKNPALAELLKKGVKLTGWIDIYASGLVATWDQAAGSEVVKKIHLYTRSDSCGAAQSWAAYLGKKQEDLRGIGIYGDPGVLEAVRRDPLGLGFNNFSFIFNQDGSVVSGVRIVPVDSNENGLADNDEVIENREQAVKAIRAGRYPATRKNYFFVKNRPAGLVKVFIEFALSEEGSKIADEAGANLSLPAQEREKILRNLK